MSENPFGSANESYQHRSFNTEKNRTFDDPKGYYTVLGLTPSASPDDIKQAFRITAKTLHPDTNPRADAAEQFRLAQEAYDFLTDPIIRTLYDYGTTTPAPDDEDNSETDFISCSCCGTITEQPRYVVFFRATGFPFFCNFREKAGTYCRDCAATQATTHSFATWFGGLWALPMGPVHAIRALYKNIKGGQKPKDKNISLLTRQASAFAKAGQAPMARVIMYQARRFATDRDDRMRIDNIIDALDDGSDLPDVTDKWTAVRRDMWVQLAPGFLLVGLAGFILFDVGFSIYAGNRLLLDSAPDHTGVFETVVQNDEMRSRAGSRVYNIPVNLNNEAQLYHTPRKTKVFYGPNKNYDIIRTIDGQTTVRLTGVLQETVWRRVMLSDGVVGYIRASRLKKGRGKKPMPAGSKIINLDIEFMNRAAPAISQKEP